MKLSEIITILEADLLNGHDKLDMEIVAGFGSDLMSDVLNRATDGVLLLTGLTNVQVIRSAVISATTAVVFVRGKQPCDDIIEQARKHGLPIMVTPFTMFTASGKLYEGGLRGIENRSAAKH